MLSPLAAALIAATLATRALPAEDEPTIVTTAPPPVAPLTHPTPRLKLSYEHLSAGNLDGSSVPLEALHLDTYPLSWRFVRAGLGAEAGRGNAKYANAAASVKYGLLGVNLGVQFPARVTPFVEGRAAAGALGGTLDGTLAIPGSTSTISNVSAVTWMYAMGVDAGAEVYFAGRAYVSLGIGWIRTTWGAARYDTMVTNNGGGTLKLQNIEHDSLLLKAGLGI
jgi:hypothetical protein